MRREVPTTEVDVWYVFMYVGGYDNGVFPMAANPYVWYLWYCEHSNREIRWYSAKNSVTESLIILSN